MPPNLTELLSGAQQSNTIVHDVHIHDFANSVKAALPLSERLPCMVATTDDDTANPKSAHMLSTTS